MKLDEAMIERATKKAVRDPALQKLLDDLPKGDPDAQPPEEIEVWVAFCEGRHIVPKGVPVSIEFGRWRGPSMPIADVIVHMRNVKTGVERGWKVQAWTNTRTGLPATKVNPGDTLRFDRCVFTA